MLLCTNSLQLLEMNKISNLCNFARGENLALKCIQAQNGFGCCPFSQEGGGVTLTFLYIHWLESLFCVQNFEFQYFGGVLRKMNICLGMKILWIYLGVITKLDCI